MLFKQNYIIFKHKQTGWYYIRYIYALKADYARMICERRRFLQGWMTGKKKG